jgi:hypothetical protein
MCVIGGTILLRIHLRIWYINKLKMHVKAEFKKPQLIAAAVWTWMLKSATSVGSASWSVRDWLFRTVRAWISRTERWASWTRVWSVRDWLLRTVGAWIARTERRAFLAWTICLALRHGHRSIICGQ